MGRKGFRKRRRRSGKGSTFKIAKAALTGVKKLRRQVETKLIGVLDTFTVPVVASGIVATPLTLIAQGLREVDRVGGVINPTSLFIRGSVAIHSATITDYDLVRVTIFRDMYNPGGVSPIASDLFEDADIHSPLEHDNFKRFKVLYDKTFNLAKQSPTVRHFKKYIRLSGSIHYNGPDATVAHMDEGNLWIITQSVQASNRPLFVFRTRVFFKDA